jgi:hypothetical protein
MPTSFPAKTVSNGISFENGISFDLHEESLHRSIHRDPFYGEPSREP